MKKWLCIVLIPLFSCYYGVNRENGVIGNLNTDCMSENAWEEINRTYSIENARDSVFFAKAAYINEMDINMEILFFEDNPKELIVVSANHYMIRHVYNPEVSSRVINGLSPSLKVEDKKRVTRRMQELIMKYQCEKGRIKSLKLLEDQW